ncbi:uncharacterized protein N7483_002546 [Penicillium malachiteum]|uniref:uncharacterized protein n=1 Tax=Penicillium malachiteum TaxID=1324776 RepID=UPI0025494235|nr:uncharacterized protein N7483_002546 [Penicillium malachiteum]KAJ5737421.1 hypothetical protein N7483_002546 [Penicillium malachiteum]
MTNFPTLPDLATRDSFGVRNPDIANIGDSDSKVLTAATSNLRDDISEVSSQSISAAQEKVNAEVHEIKASLYQYYSVGLLGYCKFRGRADAVCSHPRASFSFNLPAILDSTSASLGGLLPSLDQKGISGYRGLVQAGIGLYIAGFTTTMLAVALGGWNLRFSHGRTVFIILCTLSSLLITAATISVSVRYGLLAFGIKRILGEVGIRASLGGQMFAVAWLAVLFSFVASLIWVILLF